MESCKTGEQSWSPVRLGSSLGVLEGDLEFRIETTGLCRGGVLETWKVFASNTASFGGDREIEVLESWIGDFVFGNFNKEF